MKKSLILILALVLVPALSFDAASGQIRVEIPRIPGVPKVTKPKSDESKSEQPKTEQAAVRTDEPNQPATGETSSSQPAGPSQDKWANDGWLMVHAEDIGKVHKDVEGYNPGARDYFVRRTTYPYLLFAVSPREREEWLKRSNALDIRQSPNNKIDPALDALAAAATKKLPTYVPNMKVYRFRTPAEERMMKEKLRNLNRLKIFRVGG